MKHNAKRALSMVLAMLMCLGMFTGIVLPVNAVETTSATALPADTIFVNLGWTESTLPASYALNGKTFGLKWGVNAFNNAQSGVDAAPAGGTVYLCAGRYTSGLTIKKNLTLLGAKYGIDPNVRGKNEQDPWLWNPERTDETGEALFTSNITLGHQGYVVAHDATDITIDGLTLLNASLLNHCGAVNNNGVVKFTIKNFYIKGNAGSQTTPFVFLNNEYRPNEYRRDVTIQNVRVENLTRGGLIMLSADKADISGVYMAPSCTRGLFDVDSGNKVGLGKHAINASVSSTDEVVWNIHDNMFAASSRDAETNFPVLDLDWADSATTREVTNNVYNNIFIICGVAVNNQNVWENPLSFRTHSEKIYFEFNRNSFYHSDDCDTEHTCLTGTATTAMDYSDQVSIENNLFIGKMDYACHFTNTTAPIDIAGNYREDENGVVQQTLPVAEDANVKQGYCWYEKEPQKVGTPGYRKPLPSDTHLVNPAWTSAAVTPETTEIDDNGKIFELIWGNANSAADSGANVFSYPQHAIDACFDNHLTVYMYPGEYDMQSQGYKLFLRPNHSQKDMRIALLGAKYGIDPNVKGENEQDLWTLNPLRGNDETIVTCTVQMGAWKTGSLGAWNVSKITVDGVMLSGAGSLTSYVGNANINSEKITRFNLKNIYVKDSTLDGTKVANDNAISPFDLKPYYATSISAANMYRRDVTIENVRAENQTLTYLMQLSADKVDISGLYMHTDCTQRLFSEVSAANTAASTDAVVWNLHDNMFAAKAPRVINLNWEDATIVDTNSTIAGTNLNTTLYNRTKVTTNLNNNIFVNCFSLLDHTVYFSGETVFCRINTPNCFVNFEGNSFYQTEQALSVYRCLRTFFNKRADADLTSIKNLVTVKNNKFIGLMEYCYGGDQMNVAAQDTVDISGNYYEHTKDTNQVGIGVPLTVFGPQLHNPTQVWYWLDSEMTIKEMVPVDPITDAQIVDIETQLKWVGRTYADHFGHWFDWTGSSFDINIEGTGVTAWFDTNLAVDTPAKRAYLKVYVDGVYTRDICLYADAETGKERGQKVVLAHGLKDGVRHNIKVVKRTEGSNAYSASVALKQLWVDEGTEILVPNREATRKMQFIGDSITAGYGSLTQGERNSIPYNSAEEDGTITFAGITAEYFGADAHYIARSTAGMVGTKGSDTKTIPQMYEQFAYARKTTQWDHSQFAPNVIVINAGTNDTNAEISNDNFIAGVRAFVEKLRGYYPDAHIIYTYGFMGNSYDAALRQMVAEINNAGDSKVYYLAQKPVSGNELAHHGHPNAAAHADRAEELIALIESITDWNEHVNWPDHTLKNYRVEADIEPTDNAPGEGHHICRICGDCYFDQIVPEVASIQDKYYYYETLEEARADAEPGETIKVHKDNKIDSVFVDPGITLDLNGKTITTNYVIGFKNSAIVDKSCKLSDSSSENAGKLIVDRNNVVLDKTNKGYLPVYEDDGYIFTTVFMQGRSVWDYLEYNCSPFFGIYTHDALMNGYADSQDAKGSGVQVVVRVTWEKENNYSAVQDYYYSDSAVKDVIGSYNPTKTNYDRCFIATFTGIEADENARLTPIIVSDTGVEVAGDISLFKPQLQ